MSPLMPHPSYLIPPNRYLAATCGAGAMIGSGT